MSGADVRCWHFSDMLAGRDQVRLQGKTGGSAETAKVTRLTHSGHPKASRLTGAASYCT
jgi:hypothetical protein